MAIRGVAPTPEVSDEFRRMAVNQTPVLMIHGTLDLATPIENAEELLKYFPNGRLITVKGGTHAAAHHAASVDAEFLGRLTGFMNADDPTAALEKMPAVISLPPLQAKGATGRSLFEELAPEFGRDASRR
jgi:fermentation-respiration switch protein FrsA (DUF1100 family)